MSSIPFTSVGHNPMTDLNVFLPRFILHPSSLQFLLSVPEVHRAGHRMTDKKSTQGKNMHPVQRPKAPERSKLQTHARSNNLQQRLSSQSVRQTPLRNLPATSLLAFMSLPASNGTGAPSNTTCCTTPSAYTHTSLPDLRYCRSPVILFVQNTSNDCISPLLTSDTCNCACKWQLGTVLDPVIEHSFIGRTCLRGTFTGQNTCVNVLEQCNKLQ